MSRLHTSSIAALLGAQTKSLDFLTFSPEMAIMFGLSDIHLPTRPLIVLVLPVPGGLLHQPLAGQL
jgi:hypothetical protein